MKVLVTFTVETEDYGESEFRNELEKLIADIDPSSKLEQFKMQKVDDYFDLFNDFLVKESTIPYNPKIKKGIQS
jgi:hypothetical protein